MQRILLFSGIFTPRSRSILFSGLTGTCHSNNISNYFIQFDRGINGETVFKEHDNYLHFLRLYEKYIEPVTETYAWCLLGNHFHLLVRIKTLEEIQNYWDERDESNLSGLPDPKGFENKSNKNFIITNQFSKFFNAYVKAFNKRFKRTGSLFEKPFDRKKVDNTGYFKNLIHYIHYNSVHHGFCKRLQEYPWSSYGSVI
jgi:REP element-mobilizing transposase RayT